MFGAGLPTTYAEACQLPLVLVALARLPSTRRVAPALFAQPFFWLVCLWAAWHALTLAWSADPSEGLDQLGPSRFALVSIALWPVVRRRRLLLVWMLTGYLAGFAAQLAEIVGLWDPNPASGRDSGWWDPAVAGSILMVPLGIALSLIIAPRSRTTIWGIALTIFVVLMLIATGTRGGWLAGAGLLVIASPMVLKHMLGTKPFVTVGVVAVLSAIALGAAFGIAGDRVSEAREEISAALIDKDYDSSTGRRIQMYAVAADAFVDHPIAGVGAGGFRAYWGEWLDKRGLENSRLDHAHNAVLHTAATTGLVGLLIGLGLVVTLYRGTMVGLIGPVHARTLEAAPLLAVVGLTLVSVFDAVQLNQQTALAIGLLAGICPLRRPRERSMGF